MPGTFVNDALLDGTYGKLEQGVTLTAAGTDYTDVAEDSYGDLMRPRKVRIELKTSTVTGTTPTLDVEIQASDTTGFSSLVSLGRFSQLSGGSQSDLTRYLEVYTQKRYVRAKVTIGGTSPVYTGSTIRVKEENYKRSASDSA